MEGECAAIRILDAALISGDDVSALPFDVRMAAVEKMCKAVKVTNGAEEKKIAPVFAAKVRISFKEIKHITDNAVNLYEASLNKTWEKCARFETILAAGGQNDMQERDNLKFYY